MAARTNLGDAIKVSSTTTSGSTIQTLPACTGASKALLEFYVDTTGAAAIGDLSLNPIATCTENGENPDAGFAGVKGVRLYNTAAIILETQNAIANFKFMPFATGYTVYCQISYYK